MSSTVKVLLNQLIPPSLFGGPTAFPALSRIDLDLRKSGSAPDASLVLENCKPGLYALLLKRFSPPAAQALTLKILNIFLSRYHFRARDTILRSRPFGLVVDPSNMCELACPGCVHSGHSEELKLFDWGKGTLAQERFAALLRLYGPYAIGVYFCNYGEPLLNMKTPELIRLAKRYLMSTALSTSLSVRRFEPEGYVESGLDFMVVSVDGATQRIYERFRSHGNLELVLDNIRRLVDAKRRLGRRTPAISWNFLAFEHNAHEIPLAERTARKLGVDLFRVANPFDVRWDDPEVRPADVKSYVKRLGWTTLSNSPDNWNPSPDSIDSATVESAFSTPLSQSSHSSTAPSAGHTCHWLYKNMVMDATGRIMPCCGAPRPDTNLVFAKFDTASADPFNSEKYRQARSFFSTGAPSAGDAPYCTRCEWDHTVVNIGSPEIRRYFRAADSSFFDRRSLALLSAW